MKYLQYLYIIFFVMPFFSFNSVQAAGACSAPSAIPSLYSAGVNLPANINGNAGRSSDYSTFRNIIDQTYTCPTPGSNLMWCGSGPGQQTTWGGVIAPGIESYVSVRSGTAGTDTGSYTNNCFTVSTSGTFPASGTLPAGLQPFDTAFLHIRILDSTIARTIQLNNVVGGAIYLMSDTNIVSGMPVTTYYMNGTITVPASCGTITSTTINLPDTYSSQYSSAGSTVGTGTTQPITIQCSGGNANAVIDLRITTASSSNGDIVTSNPDIGVRVEHEGVKLIVNSGWRLGRQLVDGSVTFPLTYIPVSLTGNAPTASSYSAIATMIVSIP